MSQTCFQLFFSFQPSSDCFCSVIKWNIQREGRFATWPLICHSVWPLSSELCVCVIVFRGWSPGGTSAGLNLVKPQISSTDTDVKSKAEFLTSDPVTLFWLLQTETVHQCFWSMSFSSSSEADCSRLCSLSDLFFDNGYNVSGYFGLSFKDFWWCFFSLSLQHPNFSSHVWLTTFDSNIHWCHHIVLLKVVGKFRNSSPMTPHFHSNPKVNK